MEKNSNSQKEELAKRLAMEEEDDGISIRQRNIKFNFNADKPRITYNYQRMRFE